MGAEPSYVEALWTTVSSPVSTIESLAGGSGPSSANAAVGLSAANLINYQSQQQKQQLIDQEADALQQASGGTMSDTDAQAQASSDVTNSLIASGTDPSQNPLNNLPGGLSLTTYLWIAAGLIVLIGAVWLFLPRAVEGAVRSV
jgi:hypothetical protein